VKTKKKKKYRVVVLRRRALRNAHLVPERVRGISGQSQMGAVPSYSGNAAHCFCYLHKADLAFRNAHVTVPRKSSRRIVNGRCAVLLQRFVFVFFFFGRRQEVTFPVLPPTLLPRLRPCGGTLAPHTSGCCRSQIINIPRKRSTAFRKS
jgi:hypothetical protein